MSIEALNWALNYELDDPLVKAILIGIANHANPKGEAWPSVARLARYSGYTERAIRKGMRRAVELDLVALRERDGASNLYTLRMPDPVPASRPTPEPRSPLNEVHPCPTFIPPLNVVQPNLQEPSLHTQGRKKPSRPVPDGWRPAPEDLAWAKTNAPHVGDLNGETERFVDHALANDRRCVEWGRAWRNWIRRARPVYAPQPRALRGDPAGTAAANRERVRALFDELDQHEAQPARRRLEG